MDGCHSTPVTDEFVLSDVSYLEMFWAVVVQPCVANEKLPVCYTNLFKLARVSDVLPSNMTNRLMVRESETPRSFASLPSHRVVSHNAQASEARIC
jgi:hypothetical protein